MSELGGRQHGYVTRAQLLALGFSRSAIARRADLIATAHKGVYAVGHVDRTPIALAHAAVLACGHDAVHGIPVTGVVRTIVGHRGAAHRPPAGESHQPRLCGHLKPTALHELLSRCRRAANVVDPTQNPTGSPLEDDFAFTKRYDLPTPRINSRLSGTEVDAVFEAEKVIVELESWEFHGTR